MSNSTPTTAQVPRVDWAALKSWIAQKEAFESQHGQPAPISDEEANAIAVILRPPPRAEPTLGGQNWIGALNHWLQCRSQKATFSDEARQDPRLGKAPELRWACFVSFDATNDKLPRPGHGIDPATPNAKSPDFTRKQDAKQFAAKCACEWLISNGQMLPSGELPKFPAPFGPAAAPRTSLPPAPAVLHVPAPATASVPTKRAPSSSPPMSITDIPRVKQEPLPTRSSPSPKPNKSPAPKQKAAKAPRTTSPPKPSSPTTAAAVKSNPSSASSSAPGTPAGAPISELPLTKQVEKLASRLNLPVPRYILTEDPELSDFWNGRAEFDNNPLIPEDLGSVSKIYTKRAAREKMAQGILEWMLAKQDQRERKRKAMLGE
ncbi:hypothetical protein K4K54_006561 [Colletotrichum sp. SAR 10_86]|nr:hypothetical protein K4K54_006561 [Colletotrichum sp. SAR 10_86]